MKTYQVGESPRFTATIVDVDGTPANPTTITISIRKPDGSLAVDGIAMNNASMGSYYYDHDIAAQVGVHSLKTTATGAGGRVSIQTYEFKVVESFGV